MARKITIKDIASKLNTNISTVSRALNNNPGISERTRKLVLKTAKEMGYEPNSFAKQLRKGSSNTIGLIVPRINRVFFSNAIHGVETIAKQKGFNVFICQSNESRADETAVIETLLNNNVAGVIMSLSIESTDGDSFREIIRRKVPFVMFDRVWDSPGANKVINNNFQGAYDTVRHLIEQGYRSIAHISGPQHSNIYKDRFEGYKQALADQGIPFRDELIVKGVLTQEGGRNAAAFLLDKKIPFDSIFAAGDYGALGALQYLKEQKKRIPEEIGIAGFANEPFTELVGITSVEQFGTELGKSAARLLIEEIAEKGPSPAGKKIEINPQLIIRESSKRKI